MINEDTFFTNTLTKSAPDFLYDEEDLEAPDPGVPYKTAYLDKRFSNEIVQAYVLNGKVCYRLSRDWNKVYEGANVPQDAKVVRLGVNTQYRLQTMVEHEA